VRTTRRLFTARAHVNPDSRLDRKCQDFRRNLIEKQNEQAAWIDLSFAIGNNADTRLLCCGSLFRSRRVLFFFCAGAHLPLGYGTLNRSARMGCCTPFIP